MGAWFVSFEPFEVRGFGGDGTKTTRGEGVNAPRAMPSFDEAQVEHSEITTSRRRRGGRARVLDGVRDSVQKTTSADKHQTRSSGEEL